MKKCMRKKILSLLNVFTIVFTLVFASFAGTKTAKAAEAEFMLYVYYDGTETLYVDIWNWSGISFAEEAEVEDAFGWNKDEGVLKASSYENLFEIPMAIKDASASDGFDIYVGNSSTKLATYDSTWNNTADYAVLVSGNSSEYVVKQGTVYSSLKEAGYERSEEKTDQVEQAKASVVEISDASEVKFSEDNILTNGDFESYEEGWTIVDSLENTAKSDEWASNNKTVWFTTNNDSSSDVDFSLSQTVTKAEPGKYKLTIENEGASSESGLSIIVNEITKTLPATKGWDSWTSTEIVFEVTETTDLTVYVAGAIKAGYWGAVDNIILSKEKTEDTEEDTIDPVDAGVTVERVKGITDDFITGADVSSFLSIINSGAKFYDEDGNVLSNQGFFDLLAEGGTNYIRVRVWNNPYDSNGNGYGGGNNDLETAKVIGKYATNAGMKVLVDFHYSDFWADPAKQQAPKAWSSMSVDEKADAISSYTTEALTYLLDSGVNVGMVQVGNETTNSLCDISFGSDTENCCKLFAAGCDAVHAVAKTYNKDILAAIHFTNPERSTSYANYAARLAKYNVNYDVFASSYYPYWHGTLSNLTSVLKNVADNYGVKVMVAETSWANTLADGDGHENTVRVGNNDENNSESFDFSVQGQCTEIREVANAVANVGSAGIGLFYWENAWIPVQYAYDENGNLLEDILTSNKAAWEKYGSGWASSYAGEYDSKDAGKWFGGSAVDNQAWFDFSGKALETVKVYNYIRTGAVSPAVLDEVFVEDIVVELKDVENISVPEKATAKYSDGSSKEVDVSFDLEKLEEAKATGVGSYSIPAKAIVDGQEVEFELSLSIIPTNLLSNGGFEDGVNGWTVSKSILNTTDAASNSRTGTGCLHFWTNTQNDNATATQVVTLEPGYYTLEGFVQGGDAGESDVFTISVTVGDKTYISEAGQLNGWKNWTEMMTEEFAVKKTADATVTITISNLTSGVWGSFDDIKLYKSSDRAFPCEAAATVIENKKPAELNKDGYYEEVVYCVDCGKEMSRENKKIAAVKSIKLDKNSYTADGKSHQPNVTIKDADGKTLVQGTDYTISYSSNGKNPGAYTVKVTFKGDYKGTNTQLYVVVSPIVSKIYKKAISIISKIFGF